MTEMPPTLKGQFLMAMPALMDPNFKQSVTLITEHNENGAVGLIINQVHDGLTAKMIFRELNIDCDDQAGAIPIHIGGPVHVNELFVLHGPPLSWGQSLAITDTLALSNSREILEAIASGTGPAAFLLCLGCAGWAPGQLEWELGENAWLVSPSSDEILFELPIEARWVSAIQRLGIDPESLSDTAGHA